MTDSAEPYDPDRLARRIAAGAVAEAGRTRALCWAAGLIVHARSWADLRDVGLITAAVLVA